MNIKDLSEVLDSFIESRSNVILIDGPWGSGKTFCLKEFYTKNKTRAKIFYISLFGKTSIDDIHNELYSLAHPNFHKTKNAMRVVAKSVKLFGGAIDFSESLDFILKNNKKVEHNSIVIFDDMERINHLISFDELLGYFNTLLLSKNKIVISSDTSKIQDDSHNKLKIFQEKIIDRVYEISSTNEEIISLIFKEYCNYVSTLIVKLINNNLRTASRIMNLFSDIVDNLSNIAKLKDWTKVLSYERLLLYCALIVAEFSHVDLFDFHMDTDDEKKSYDYIRFEIGHDEHKAKRIYRIKAFAEKYRYDYSDMNDLLNQDISLIMDVFYTNNFRRLQSKFKSSSNLESDPFYLSDRNKLKFFNETYQNLINLQQRILPQHFKHVKDLIDISNSFNVDLNLNKISDVFSEKLIDNSDVLFMEKSFLEKDTPNQYIDFLEQVTLNYNSKYIANFYKSIIDSSLSKSYTELGILFEKLENEPIFRNNNGILEDSHLQFLQLNEFFLPKLDDNIDRDEWLLSYKIVKCLINLKREDSIKVYLNNLIFDCGENISKKNRLITLVKLIK